MSLAVRILARIDAKPTLGAVKGVRYDGLRRLGPAAELAVEYEDQGADEIIMLDVTASLYGRPPAWDYLASVSQVLSVPFTYGGGIRTVEDFRRAIRQHAEKVALNTAACERPEIITDCAREFGSQAVVVSIEAKRRDDHWVAYTHGGRERSGRDVVQWAREAERLGAGELLVTSVDRDGTQAGYDEALVRAVAGAVTVPVIASGGAGSPADVGRILQIADAAAVGTWLHNGGTIGAIKRVLQDSGMEVRG